MATNPDLNKPIFSIESVSIGEKTTIKGMKDPSFVMESLGKTDGGVTLATTSTTTDINSDQGLLASLSTGTTYNVTINAKSNIIKNIVLGFGGYEKTDGSGFTFGQQPSAPVKSIKIRTKKSAGQLLQLDILIPAFSIDLNTSTDFNNDDGTLIPLAGKAIVADTYTITGSWTQSGTTVTGTGFLASTNYCPVGSLLLIDGNEYKVTAATDTELTVDSAITSADGTSAEITVQGILIDSDKVS